MKISLPNGHGQINDKAEKAEHFGELFLITYLNVFHSGCFVKRREA